MSSTLYGKEIIINNDKKSKFAYFFTIHNAFDELELNTKFFNRSLFLKSNFDIVINCNGQKNDRLYEIAKKFQAPTVKCFFDSRNEGKHLMGPPEQLDNSYEELVNYDLIFHLHADVYTISDHGLKKFIKDFTNSKEQKDFYVFPLPNRDKQYAFDAWLFKPLESNNIFKNWQEYTKTPRSSGAEPYFYDAIHMNNKTVGLFDRGPCAGMEESYEPISGLIDTTNINKAKFLLENFK